MVEFKNLFVVIAIILNISPNHALVEKFIKSIVINTTLVEKQCYETTKSHVAFNKVMEESVKFTECMKNVSLNDMDREIEKAKTDINFDPIIDKVCNAKDDFFICSKPMSNSIEVCLPDELRSIHKIIEGIIKSVADFACANLNTNTFLSIIGCAVPKEIQLKACFEKYYGGLIFEKPENVDKFILFCNQLNCTTFDNFSNCIVDEFRTCNDATPANLFSTLFEQIKNEISCENYSFPHYS